MKRRRDRPPSSASTIIFKTIFCTELALEIGAQMVYDVREDLTKRYHGCSVCYAIAGEEDRSHESGDACRKLPLSAVRTQKVGAISNSHSDSHLGSCAMAALYLR